MPKYNRGGKNLSVGDIGRFKCLRQHLALPGETIRPQVSGNVRLAGLRQQTSVYLHAQIECFAAPLRWYWSSWPDYVRDGINHGLTLPVETAAPYITNNAYQNMGIGKVTGDFLKFFAQHPVNIWNEWYRWPEDSKLSVTTPPLTFFQDQGQPVVNLACCASRLHDAVSLGTNEYQVASASTLDVRDLAAVQARFAQGVKSDWTSMDKYQQFMRDIFGAPGSPEVDTVPHRLRNGAELSVMPRDMYASDAAGLGEIMSINNFQVDHDWEPYYCKEHMIFAYVLVLRFAPVYAGAVNPLLYTDVTPYAAYQGDPEVLANLQPEPVSSKEVSDGDATVVGYAPAGWQWREGYSHVDQHIEQLLTFPLYDGYPQTAAGFRDASAINPGTFRSAALRHWFADLNFNIQCSSRTPSAGQSITAGAGESRRGPKGLHPSGGYLV